MRRWHFSSESVAEGHPDKVADRIADAVLDSVLADDPEGRVACEVMVTTGLAIVAGEMSADSEPDYDAIARRAIVDIGYTDADEPFSADAIETLITIHGQSGDIANGVLTSLEHRNGSVDPRDELGAGDQGFVFGYANDDTPEFMPLPIQLAHQLARRMAELRKGGELGYLRPDGKTQVTVEYEDDRPVRVSRVLMSAHHRADAPDNEEMAADLEKLAANEVVPDIYRDETTEFLFNPSGRFESGGPNADTGLTGRKIVVDTYGGFARHGGGGFSGKDPTKVDRSASYAARHAAKNIVAAGLATRCELQIAYAIGQAKPFSVFVEPFGTSTIDPDRLSQIVSEIFDFRPSAIIERFDLRRPIYQPTSAYGHFGRSGFPWEVLDAVEDLQRAAGR